MNDRNIGYDAAEPPERECEWPRCPVCGAATDRFYRRGKDREIVGCDECIDIADAWETSA